MQLDFDDGPDGRPRHRNLRHPQHRLAAGGNVKRQTIIPGFLLAFLVLASANSAGVMPMVLLTFGAERSRWALPGGMLAVGMKTSLYQFHMRVPKPLRSSSARPFLSRCSF
ncbi:putative sulfate exporter family transporter [Candidatus Phyllobacterium onerii]|uniref:putative sulfate exporter family transporter n=1 Tax=Candidatus Phyllobacterium onerii TaxID=3020828 RepID=UPI003A855C56